MKVRFFHYAMKYKKYYIISIISLVLGVVFDAIVPKLIGILIDKVIIEQRLNLSLRILSLLLLFSLLSGVFKFIMEFAADNVSNLATNDIRTDLFLHIKKQNGAFFVINKEGDLLSRTRHDSEQLGFMFGFLSLFSIQIVVHVLIMFIALLYQNAKLALVALFMVPALGFLAYKSEKSGMKIYDEISDETAKMNQTAGESITGIRTVKAFNKARYEIDRFNKRNNHFFNLNVKLERTYAKYDSAISSLGRIMVGLVIFIGAFFVMNDRISLGELASSTVYINNLISPMMEIGWIIQEIAAAFASKKKIAKILESRYEVEVDEKYDELDSYNLEYKSVSFKEVLKDISFTLKEGSSLGIMGPTGSGKSVLLSLLNRFIDPTSGEILLDNKNIKNISLKTLRDVTSYVTQDVFLFSQTIRENIKKGKQSSISDDKMIHYAKLSDVDSFVSRLEKRYETIIGERGVGLSGGQKQRVSIARALAKEGKILILDDATSALDMETEKRLQRALNEITTLSKIIIAHRVSSVRYCDEIIFLENGEIKERGNHEELMAMKGLYYKTYLSQYSLEDV